jgi:hypothetical protein
VSTTDRDAGSGLERAYRTLLLAYPTVYREERGEELLSTLLAAAPPGRRRPSIVDALDLLYHGLRTRACITRRTLLGPAAGGALARAAAISLIMAAAVAVAVIVGVSLLGLPVFYRWPERSYPVPLRVGAGLVLATYPAALGVVFAAAATGIRGQRAVGTVTSRSGLPPSMNSRPPGTSAWPSRSSASAPARGSRPSNAPTRTAKAMW